MFAKKLKKIGDHFWLKQAFYAAQFTNLRLNSSCSSKQVSTRVFAGLIFLYFQNRMLDCNKAFEQWCGSKYIEFGSGSRIMAQFGSGSRVILTTLKQKIQNNLNFREKLFSLKQVYF